MAKKKKLIDTSENPLFICCECGKKGEMVIGPYGQGRCNECISKSNKPTDKHKKPFMYDKQVAKIETKILE